MANDSMALNKVCVYMYVVNLYNARSRAQLNHSSGGVHCFTLYILNILIFCFKEMCRFM